MVRGAQSEEIIATLRAGTRHDLVILAIPSHDRENKPLHDQDQWADGALELFSDLYEGATAFKTFKGIYRSDSGKDLWDNPILIESFAERTHVENPHKLRTLLDFVRRMKAKMRQESILLVVNEYRWFL
jgi:hypothetical protein